MGGTDEAPSTFNDALYSGSQRVIAYLDEGSDVEWGWLLSMTDEELLQARTLATWTGAIFLGAWFVTIRHGIYQGNSACCSDYTGLRGPNGVNCSNNRKSSTTCHINSSINLA